MNREEFLTAFHTQLDTLHDIAKSLNLRKDLPVSLGDVQGFAEWLILCPDVGAATIKMREGQGVALVFLEIAAFQEQAIDEIRTSGGLGQITAGTPFFALASSVLEYLAFLKKSAPARWKEYES